MMELLRWLQALSDLNAQAILNLNVSNIIFISYLIGYVITRKSALISVFLFTELLGVSNILDELSNVMYYLVHASIYLCLYWWLNSSKLIKNKQLLTCFIIALLSIGMALDAYIYTEIETLFYSSYEYLFMVVHLLFICSFINFKRIIINARSIIDKRVRLLASSHNSAFSNKINKG